MADPQAGAALDALQPGAAIEVLLNVYDVAPPEDGGGAAPLTRINNLVRRRRAPARGVRALRAAHRPRPPRPMHACMHACMHAPMRPGMPHPMQTRNMFGGVGGVFHGAIVIGDVEYSFGFCVSARAVCSCVYLGHST